MKQDNTHPYPRDNGSDNSRDKPYPVDKRKLAWRRFCSFWEGGSDALLFSFLVALLMEAVWAIGRDMLDGRPLGRPGAVFESSEEALLAFILYFLLVGAKARRLWLAMSPAASWVALALLVAVVFAASRAEWNEDAYQTAMRELDERADSRYLQRHFPDTAGHRHLDPPAPPPLPLARQTPAPTDELSDIFVPATEADHE